MPTANERAKCGLTAEMQQKLQSVILPGSLYKTTYGDVSKRSYVISVAATGEYTTWAGSQSNALARIVTTINNVNAVYERDYAISFTLNSPNTILFTNAGSDPYSEGSTTLSGTSLNENQTTLSTGTTGTAVTNGGGFNLGHVFNAGWSGGLAATPSACNAANKGRAASGLDPAVFSSGPSGPVFDLTVAHEICHQFSGQHSLPLIPAAAREIPAALTDGSRVVEVPSWLMPAPAQVWPTKTTATLTSTVATWHR